MTKSVSLILMMALSLSCLYSCEKPDKNDIESPEEEKEVHPYELNISSDGLDNVNFLDLCVNMTSSNRYDFMIDDECDWVEFANIEQATGSIIPYITVHPNTTGQSRSVEVIIQSQAQSSSLFYDKHLLVQDAK